MIERQVLISKFHLAFESWQNPGKKKKHLHIINYAIVNSACSIVDCILHDYISDWRPDVRSEIDHAELTIEN